MPTPFIEGFLFVLQPLNALLLGTGALLGLLLGILPGLRAIHGAALFLPIAYAIGLDPKTALAFLISIYFASLTSGRIAHILELAGNQPEELTVRQLKLSNICVLLSVSLAMTGLVLVIVLLHGLQIRFGPPEYVVLVVFAFASLSIQAGRFPARTLISTAIGVLLATIGIDANTGVLRFTFGQPELYDGIEVTSIAIGIFVISEIMVMLDQRLPSNRKTVPLQTFRHASPPISPWTGKLIKASLAGFAIGLIPGTGASAVSSFDRKERSSATNSTVTIDQRLNNAVVIETARAAAAGGALVPMLAFCIPGNSTTAIMIGALFLYNIPVGPSLFLHSIDIIWGLFAALAITSGLLFSIHRPLCLLISRVPVIPAWVFIPGLICLAFTGTYAVHQSWLSLALMLLFGGAGYLLQKFHYPLIPLLLGFILGELLEDNLRRALTWSGGEIHIFFSGPICQILWFLILLIIIVPLILRRRRAE